jgi:hypothetical protein
MGTSKSYSASIKGQPQWGQLSSSVTSNCGTGKVGAANLSTILSRYVLVIGGASRAGRGNSKISGRAGIRTAKNIGGFLGAFQSSGNNLTRTFSTLGFDNLGGKSVPEVIDYLLETLSGPSSTIDDVAAKSASQKILEELAGNATTITGLENNLKEVLTANGLEEILIKYFGYYIFEHLSVMFYEKLVVEKGKKECNDLFKQIKEFIIEKLTNTSKKRDISKLDWKGNEADLLIKGIQEDVLKIFENYEG